MKKVGKGVRSNREQEEEVVAARNKDSTADHGVEEA